MDSSWASRASSLAFKETLAPVAFSKAAINVFCSASPAVPPDQAMLRVSALAGRALPANRARVAAAADRVFIMGLLVLNLLDFIRVTSKKSLNRVSLRVAEHRKAEMPAAQTARLRVRAG